MLAKAKDEKEQLEKNSNEQERQMEEVRKEMQLKDAQKMQIAE